MTGDPTLETVAIRPGLCLQAAFAGLGPGGARPSGRPADHGADLRLGGHRHAAGRLAGWLLTLQRLRRRETVLRPRSYGTVTVAFGPGVSLPTLRDLLATMGFRVKAGTLIQGEDGGSLRRIGSHRGDSRAWALDAVARLRAVRRAGRI